MRRYLGAWLAVVFVCAMSAPAHAGGDSAKEIVDKAIKALGGEEKLSKIAAFTWTANAAIKANGSLSDSVFVVTFMGLDRARRDFLTRAPYRLILDGAKGWYTARGEYRPMDKDAIAQQKRNIYLQVVPTLLVPLKSGGFRYEAIGEEEVRGKTASILKIIGPDGKDFTLSFDKESNLPVKEAVRSIGADGKEQIEETFFTAYKEIGGIKKATAIETRTDPLNYGYFDIIEFRVIDRVPPGTFTPPE